MDMYFSRQYDVPRIEEYIMFWKNLNLIASKYPLCYHLKDVGRTWWESLNYDKSIFRKMVSCKEEG